MLIKEITRRVNKEGIFQAVYTAGILLPKPISVCQYWHRSLNPKKLVEVHFSALHKHMTLQRMIKLYRLPEVGVCVCVCVCVSELREGEGEREGEREGGGEREREREEKIYSYLNAVMTIVIIACSGDKDSRTETV